MKKNILSLKKESQFSIFYIMLCINLFSITLLSCFNYFVFHNMNSKAYLESFISYNQRVANLAFINIDKHIMETAFEIPQLYFSSLPRNVPLLRPQNERIDHDPAKINALTAPLEEIRKSYPYIESLDIYYPATGTIVTGFNYVHFAENRQIVDAFLPWYPDFEAKRTSQIFCELSDNIYPSRESVLTYIKRISQPLRKDNDIIVAIHISPSSLATYIDDSEGTLIIASPDNQIKYYSQKYGAAYADSILRSSAMDGTPFSLTVDGEETTVFNYRSPSTKLNYMYCIQNNTFYADYNTKTRIFIMNFLISILFNLAILILISILNYAAYKKRILFFSKKAGISIEKQNTGFDDSLSIISEEITNLNATVKSSEPLLFQNTVRSLILNRKSETSYSQLCSGQGFHRVCTFIIHLPAPDYENLEVSQLQQDVSFVQNCDILFTTLEKGELIAVVLFDKEHYEKIIDEFIQWLDKQFSDYTLVSGNSYELTKENIKNSFKSASEISKYQFIFTAAKFLKYEEITLSIRKSYGSHLKLFDAIEKDILGENLLDYKYHIEALVTSFKNGNYTIDYCLSTLRDLVTLLYQTMLHRELDMWVVYGYDIREYYKQLTNIDMFQDWINNLCEVLLQNMRQKKRSVDVNMKDRLLKLIDDNLEHDITLDFLSDQLSLRPAVLSRLFKQLLGEGYTEYIRRRKLTRAIQLMNENYTMKTIAQILGYNSPQYFIKIFKEAYGLTPYQYKKAHKAEPDNTSNE